ncbi:hypothetical protein [Streptomyces sp. NPDC054765]
MLDGADNLVVSIPAQSLQANLAVWVTHHRQRPGDRVADEGHLELGSG